MGYSLAAQHFVNMIHDECVSIRAYSSEGYEQKIGKFSGATRNFWLRMANTPISHLSDAARHKFLSTIFERTITSSDLITNVEAHVISAVYASFPYDIALKVVEEIVNVN